MDLVRKQVWWVRIARCQSLALVCLMAGQAAEFDSARIAGTVTDSSGRLLAGAQVLVNRTTDAEVERETGLPSTITDPKGNYHLTLRFVKGQTLVVREVFADMKGFVRAAPPLAIPLRGGETTNISFTLNPGLVVAGNVKLPLLPTEESEKPESVRRLLMVSGPTLDDVVQNGRVYFTEPGGHFEIYLPAGQYSLQAIAYSAEPPEWKGIKAGQSNILLELPSFVWSEAEVGRVFDEFWHQMDLQYSYFFLKEVDWKALKDKFRPKAIQATNAHELGAVLQEMLEPLHDLHIWIQAGREELPTYRSSYAFNGNRRDVAAQLEGVTECGKFAAVGRTKADGFGYFMLIQQSAANRANVKQAIEAIKKLRDAPGFIVDLRSANGGSEPLALEIARLFCGEETVYARSKYRNGPKHDAFTPAYERTLPASSDPYLKPAVCLIGPGAVSSGEGFVQMMACLPHVTTVGLPTRGASGNPGPWTLSRTGVTVYFSRWVDLMPDGHSFEGVGISPAVDVKEPVSAYAQSDPTFEKGIEILREKTTAASKPNK